MVDRAIDRGAHRRDPPTQVPYGPSSEPLQSVGQPTWGSTLLSESMRAPVVSDFPAWDTPRPAKAPELLLERPHFARDKG